MDGRTLTDGRTETHGLKIAIFGHTDLKICLYGVVFRVEFDGAVHFYVGPQKLTVLLIFHSMLMIFQFSDFLEKARFFFSRRPQTACKGVMRARPRRPRRGRRNGGPYLVRESVTNGQ